MEFRFDRVRRLKLRSRWDVARFGGSWRALKRECLHLEWRSELFGANDISHLLPQCSKSGGRKVDKKIEIENRLSGTGTNPASLNDMQIHALSCQAIYRGRN
jgi:hypothetical protein